MELSAFLFPKPPRRKSHSRLIRASVQSQNNFPFFVRATKDQASALPIIKPKTTPPKGLLFFAQAHKHFERREDGISRRNPVPGKTAPAIGILPAHKAYFIAVVNRGRTGVREKEGCGQKKFALIFAGQGQKPGLIVAS